MGDDVIDTVISQIDMGYLVTLYLAGTPVELKREASDRPWLLLPFASHREYVTYLDGALHTPTFKLDDDGGDALFQWLDGEVAGRGLHSFTLELILSNSRTPS
jgi:hypothetical protein